MSFIPSSKAFQALQDLKVTFFSLFPPPINQSPFSPHPHPNWPEMAVATILPYSRILLLPRPRPRPPLSLPRPAGRPLSPTESIDCPGAERAGRLPHGPGGEGRPPLPASKRSRSGPEPRKATETEEAAQTTTMSRSRWT